MNFKLDDDLLEDVYDIFEHIEEKLDIGLNSFVYDSKEEHLKKNIVKNLLKQLCLMKRALEKTRIIKLI